MPAKPKDFSRYANDISMDRYTLHCMWWEDAVRVRDSYPVDSRGWNEWNDTAKMHADSMRQLDK